MTCFKALHYNGLPESCVHTMCWRLSEASAVIKREDCAVVPHNFEKPIN